MPQTITNQASLNYQYNGQNARAVSNIATATLTEPLSAAKRSVESVYQGGQELTSIISLVNSSAAALNNVTVADDLGTYPLETGSATPLIYEDPAHLYINGAYIGAITPTQTENSVTFTIATLAAGANAQIVYKALVNNLAPLAVGSTITNTAEITADGLNNPVEAVSRITVESYAEVSILKGMSPASIVDGSAVTYTFTVHNSGNTEATDIVLSDTFNPAPSNIAVQVDGEAVLPANYTYTGGVLTLPAGTGYSISLPAADISQDPATGLVTIVPSSVTITVTGIL